MIHKMEHEHDELLIKVNKILHNFNEFEHSFRTVRFDPIYEIICPSHPRQEP